MTNPIEIEELAKKLMETYVETVLDEDGELRKESPTHMWRNFAKIIKSGKLDKELGAVGLVRLEEDEFVIRLDRDKVYTVETLGKIVYKQLREEIRSEFLNSYKGKPTQDKPDTCPECGEKGEK